MRILNRCVFASASKNGTLVSYFKKMILKILKKIQSIVNSFIKSSCQSKESPHFWALSSFSPTATFLEKKFHPHPYGQIRGSSNYVFLIISQYRRSLVILCLKPSNYM